MAGISQAIPIAFKFDLLSIIAGHTLKIALYSIAAGASLDANTAAYTTTGEVVDASYVAGGLVLSLTSGTPVVNGSSVSLTFQDISWPASGIVADGALIYDATNNNRAVMVIAFPGPQTAVTGTFTVQFSTAPAPAIQIA